MSVERTLHHFPLDPISRQVRLALGEKRLPFADVTVRYWERPKELTKLNPSGMIPVLVEEQEDGPPLVVACVGARANVGRLRVERELGPQLVALANTIRMDAAVT